MLSKKRKEIQQGCGGALASGLIFRLGRVTLECRFFVTLQRQGDEINYTIKHLELQEQNDNQILNKSNNRHGDSGRAP